MGVGPSDWMGWAGCGGRHSHTEGMWQRHTVSGMAEVYQAADATQSISACAVAERLQATDRAYGHEQMWGDAGKTARNSTAGRWDARASLRLSASSRHTVPNILCLPGSRGIFQEAIDEVLALAELQHHLYCLHFQSIVQALNKSDSSQWHGDSTEPHNTGQLAAFI